MKNTHKKLLKNQSSEWFTAAADFNYYAAAAQTEREADGNHKLAQEEEL
jgi:hypothetical protein